MMTKVNATNPRQNIIWEVEKLTESSRPQIAIVVKDTRAPIIHAPANSTGDFMNPARIHEDYSEDFVYRCVEVSKDPVPELQGDVQSCLVEPAGYNLGGSLAPFRHPGRHQNSIKVMIFHTARRCLK